MQFSIETFSLVCDIHIDLCMNLITNECQKACQYLINHMQIEILDAKVYSNYLAANGFSRNTQISGQDLEALFVKSAEKPSHHRRLSLKSDFSFFQDMNGLDNHSELDGGNIIANEVQTSGSIKVLTLRTKDGSK